MHFIKLTMPIDLTPSPAQQRLYYRLSGYAETHQIPLLDFWTCPRYCLTLEEFLALLEDSGFIISPQEIAALEKEGVQFVNLQAVLNSVSFWKEQEGSVGAFASKQAKSKVETVSKTQRVSKVSAAASSRIRAVQREWKKQVKLNETLIRTKNEANYEVTVKVGEANDICKRLKNNTSFIVESKGDLLKIVEEGKNGSKELSLRNFQREYERLKKEVLSQGEEWEGTLEDDLKKTLVEVMYLSGQLEEQIKVLEDKGVTH